MEYNGTQEGRKGIVTLKKLYLQVLFILFIIITSACEKSYNGEYTRWGDTEESVDTKRLEENNIPYKIENGRVYIPKDAFDKAIFCCS